MISFDEALALVEANARPVGSETLPLGKSAGRVLATAVRAGIDSPRADVSSMDGYAVATGADVSVGARFEMAGEAFPGTTPLPALQSKQCVRIFTGAPLPMDADRVIIQEDVDRTDASIVVRVAQGESRFVRRRASDFAEGDDLLAARTFLTPRALVTAAAADCGEVDCFIRPRIALLATGDELRAAGVTGSATSIPESLSVGLAAFGEAWGGEVASVHREPDDLAHLQQVAAGLVEAHDLLVVTGGASVGERDFGKAMFEPLGLDLIFSKVAIRPGKPVWFGRVGMTLILGLPGNPTSAMVTARLFLAPLLAGMTGQNARDAVQWEQVELTAPLKPCDGRESFSRARRDGDRARPFDNQDSGAQATLAAADWLLRQRPNTPALNIGDRVEALAF
ncbi:molybdopterin molybdotransferase MoeA [Sphingomonas sp. LY160]|uniref:molybdopterin molybdotransferase MoeA n=1 Tax=Sphingomonas sp. LY160 TaxID=3095342 RepID=UPI002ADEE4E1|nr:molybdopterin molybdotransferase MoeA [Sphingomonas sp. LY160]MEA1072282.1 molybdopterin molybdotransferase MoeA [Sphingomonas sp. LY160]